jgi:predicted aspartyl protease
MPAYDSTRFDPPAPLVLVTLRNPNTGSVCPDVPLLLDTGADVSLVPRAAVSRLGVTAAPDRRYELIAFDGTVSLAPVVQLELVFCRRTFRGQFLLIDQEWGILGRNVLNAVSLLLDGPRLTWDEHRPLPVTS